MTARVTARRIAAADPAAFELAAAALRRGELIAVPTETVYGLVVLPAEAPLGRLLEAKQRSTDKGIQLLIDSLEQASILVDVPPLAARLAERFWPGPLTLVLTQARGTWLPALLTGGRGTVGLRVPDHELPRRLARLHGPLAASSANISGKPPATTADLVLASLGRQVTLVLDDGPVRGGVASTVVAVDSAGLRWEVLREGALSRAQIVDAVTG